MAGEIIFPFGRPDKIEPGRGRGPDFIAAVVLSHSTDSRLGEAEVFVVSEGLVGTTLDPFRMAGVTFRRAGKNLSRNGGVLCGGVEGCEREVEGDSE